MQTTVLIGIFTDLLIKKKTTREALSKKYELSARTITRYIDVLTSAGVPIESRAGIGGGYCLPDSYKIDRMLFSDAERKRIAQSLNDTLFLYPDPTNKLILEKLGAEETGIEPSAPETVIEIEFRSALKEEVVAWLGEKSVYGKNGDLLRAKAKLRGSRGLKEKILSFGSGVRVLNPPGLKDAVSEECRKILEN